MKGISGAERKARRVFVTERKARRLFSSINIHIAFLALGVFLVFTGHGVLFFLSVASAFLHELAHATAGVMCGSAPPSIRLLPYGACAEFSEPFEAKRAPLIFAVGPLASAVVAFVAYLCGQKLLFWVNVQLFALNILPFYPLDGARLVIAMSKNKIKALRNMRKAGVVAGAGFVLLSIASVIFKFNPTLGIMGIFLYIGATEGVDKEELQVIYDKVMEGFSAGCRA